jgi:uncharacterized membrane protein
MENQNQKKSNNKWLALINIPIQMGVIIFAFAYFGNWLDEKYHKQVFVKILVLLGVAISFYNLNRQLKDINKSE